MSLPRVPTRAQLFALAQAGGAAVVYRVRANTLRACERAGWLEDGELTVMGIRALQRAGIVDVYLFPTEVLDRLKEKA